MTQKLAFADDHFHDECGVFGVFGHPEASNLAYLGLYALQHRGQESAGIVSSDGKELYVHRAMGEVEEIFQPSVLAQLPGSLAIGHTRYSTAGDKALLNAQPIMIASRLDFSNQQRHRSHRPPHRPLASAQPFRRDRRCPQSSRRRLFPARADAR